MDFLTIHKPFQKVQSYLADPVFSLGWVASTSSTPSNSVLCLGKSSNGENNNDPKSPNRTIPPYIIMLMQNVP